MNNKYVSIDQYKTPTSTIITNTKYLVVNSFSQSPSIGIHQDS